MECKRLPVGWGQTGADVDRGHRAAMAWLTAQAILRLNREGLTDEQLLTMIVSFRVTSLWCRERPSGPMALAALSPSGLLQSLHM